MKITKLDRRRAIRRFPEFEKDLGKYNKLKSPDKRVQFAIKCTMKWKDEFEAIARAEEQAEKWSYTKKGKTLATRFKERGNVDNVITITDKPYLIIYTEIERVATKETIRIPYTLSGNSLYLKIKLKGKRLDHLMEELHEVVKLYHTLANPSYSERNRKTDIYGKDIWAVYDLWQETGQDINETTIRLHDLKVKDLPKRSEGQDYLQQTQTAIRNAITIMQDIRTEFSLEPLIFKPLTIRF